MILGNLIRGFSGYGGVPSLAGWLASGDGVVEGMILLFLSLYFELIVMAMAVRLKGGRE